MRRGQDDVADSTDQTDHGDDDTALLGFIGNVGGKDDHDECKEVGWSGEALGVGRGETKLGDYGGKVYRKGGETDVGAEVHESGEEIL